jgi:hypothetical protein
VPGVSWLSLTGAAVSRGRGVASGPPKLDHVSRQRGGLVGVALLASSTNVVPDLITTVAAIVGVAAMIYGVATSMLIVSIASPMSDRDQTGGRVARLV